MQQDPIVIVGLTCRTDRRGNPHTASHPVIVLEQRLHQAPSGGLDVPRRETGIVGKDGSPEELVARGLIADRIQYRDRLAGLYAESIPTS